MIAMPALRTRVELYILLAAAVLAWALWPAKPAPERVEARPQVTQHDGSVIAATAPPGPRLPPPRHVIPKGYTEERRESVVIAPTPAASSVEVDLSLVRGEHDRRMITSSPDGTVLSAVDIPIDPAPLPPPEKPWAAGLSYGSDRAVGVWVERDLGRLRAGLEVERSAVATTARVRLGVRW
jgi:hypothetical protein